MKILHIADERRTAQLSVAVLRRIAPNSTHTWTASPGSILAWLRANPAAAALIIEAEVQRQSCDPHVAHLRALGLDVPVVVAGPDQPGRRDAALRSGASAYVARGPAFEANLARSMDPWLRRAPRTDVETPQSPTPDTSGGPASVEALEAKLADAEARRRDAEERGALTERALRDAQQALADAEQRRSSEIAEADARFAEAGRQHDAALGRANAICTALQDRLLELEAAAREAHEQRASHAAASADQLAQRHAEFAATLALATQRREALTRTLSETIAALEDERRARTAEAAAAADRLARRQGELAAARAEAADVTKGLQQRLVDADTALRQTREGAAADLAAAAEREARLDERLAKDATNRRNLEAALAASEAARLEARERHAAEAASAAGQIEELQSRHDAAVSEHAAVRAALERDLAAARDRMAQGRQRSQALVTSFRRRVRERQQQLVDVLSLERDAAARALAASADERERTQQHAARLEHSLEAAGEQVRLLEDSLAVERQAHQETRQSGDGERRRLSSECDRLRQQADQLRSAFEAIEQIAAEHVAERNRLEQLVADRDAELTAQASRQRAAEHAARQGLVRIQDELQRTIDSSAAEIARLQGEAVDLRRALEAHRGRADELRIIADRVPALQAELEQRHRDIRRQFEQAPHALCVCTPDGRIVRANHSMAKLLGCRRTEDLRGLDFAAAAFESAADVKLLVELATRTGKTESVETTWQTRDGRRLLVRVDARLVDGSVEIVVCDLTAVRALEQRLRQAQRMEAVGRVAAEVAVTCETLLGDAVRDGRQWLADVGAEAAQRHQGERLLDEVARAAGFLRQLAVYGQAQASDLQPVNVQRTLRDLEPVLKRVAGEDVEVVLPRTSALFDVDVDAERVERILVNVASYARARMPQGGRVRIDLTTTAVGRRFMARYPNVRPGPHVLITIAEVRTAQPARADGSASIEPVGRPGVDLGTLLSLVGTCGGHLWMEAESSGNMMIKIHLPRRSPDNTRGAAATGSTDASSVRRSSRWFRSGTRAAPPAATPVS